MERSGQVSPSHRTIAWGRLMRAEVIATSDVLWVEAPSSSRASIDLTVEERRGSADDRAGALTLEP